MTDGPSKLRQDSSTHCDHPTRAKITANPMPIHTLRMRSPPIDLPISNSRVLLQRALVRISPHAERPRAGVLAAQRPERSVPSRPDRTRLLPSPFESSLTITPDHLHEH